MSIKNLLITLISSLFLLSCAGKATDIVTLYKDDGTKLETKKYLDGNLEGWGVLQNKDGVVTKKFTITISGSWEGDRGVVKRQFAFNDGKKDSRTWLITADGNNLTAVGHDIIGNAVGKEHAGVSQMMYTLSMDIDGIKENIKVEELTHKVGKDSSISILSLKKGFTNKGQIIMNLKKTPMEKTKEYKIEKTNDPVEEVKSQSKPNPESIPGK